jgi:alpha-maltose-1-phosphate synthase
MRILFLSSLYPPRSKGGGELSTQYLAEALAQRGHTIVVLTSSPSGRTEEVMNGVAIVRLPIPFTAKPLFEKAWAARAAAALADELDEQEPFDVIHCHDFRTAQVVAALGLPNAIATVRDYAFICGSPNNILADGSPCPGCEHIGTVVKNRAVVEAPIFRKPFRVWQYWHNIEFRKSTLRSFAHQVYISSAQRDIIEKRLGTLAPHKAVIYNPVPEEYLRERPVRTMGKTILYVGTVESYKGIGLLLDAFHALSQQHPELQLRVVGEGAQRQQYEQQVARWGLQYRVAFTGRVAPERMRAVYDEAWLVVAPHIWAEPFGRTVIEAMARERVVVAAATGGPRELLQDGVTGILCAGGSVESLQKSLERAIKLSEIDRREMQHAARAWVANHLTPAQIAEQYEQFYQAR